MEGVSERNMRLGGNEVNDRVPKVLEAGVERLKSGSIEVTGIKLDLRLCSSMRTAGARASAVTSAAEGTREVDNTTAGVEGILELSRHSSSTRALGGGTHWTRRRDSRLVSTLFFLITLDDVFLVMLREVFHHSPDASTSSLDVLDRKLAVAPNRSMIDRLTLWEGGSSLRVSRRAAHRMCSSGPTL